MLMFGLALILVMLWRPAGLWPSTQRRREFAADDGVLHQEQETVYDASK
jgi:branched-chain amino acid transport system permease protein